MCWSVLRWQSQEREESILTFRTSSRWSHHSPKDNLPMKGNGWPTTLMTSKLLHRIKGDLLSAHRQFPRSRRGLLAHNTQKSRRTSSGSAEMTSPCHGGRLCSSTTTIGIRLRLNLTSGQKVGSSRVTTGYSTSPSRSGRRKSLQGLTWASYPRHSEDIPGWASSKRISKERRMLNGTPGTLSALSGADRP